MKEIIEEKKDRTTTVNERAINRDPKTKQLVNRYQEKESRLCYDRRAMIRSES